MYLKFSNVFLRQLLLTITGVVTTINVGSILAFSSIFLAQTKNNSFPLTVSEESWLASAPIMLMFPICLISFLLIEKGRKIAFIISELIGFTSWILLYFSNDYQMLIISRILAGVSMGILYPTIITFIGEVSIPKYRTPCVTMISVGQTIGIFICQYLGEYIEWRIVAAIFIFCPLHNLLALILFLKESYVTELDRNNLEKARELFESYRGNTPEAKYEFDLILLDKKKQKKESCGNLAELCRNKSFLIPFGITTLVYLTNQLSATQAVVVYTSSIIDLINDDPNFAFYATLALNITRMITVILSVFLVKISTVRFVLISTGYCLGISLLALGLFMYLSEVFIATTFPILSLCALVMITVFYNLGLGPLPSVVCAEMFPEATRAVGGSVSASLSFLFLFIVVKFMPAMMSIGPYWTFGIFGVCTLIGITASNFVLPNTKDKSLQEINMMYQNNNN